MTFFHFDCLRSDCEILKTQNFTKYIKFIKVAQNTHTKNVNIKKQLYWSFYKFVEDPFLFDNLGDLIEIDPIHQNSYQQIQGHSSDVDIPR